ncbi:MAG: DNRLRE domain-containing protein [Bacteroidales bacterium]|nr:DNRLRE domain-containing protein [Bacteroidales bacterium]
MKQLHTIKLFVLLTLTCVFSSNINAQKRVTTNDIDWKSFMSQHDMYWDRITADYYAGAILGNGLLGSNFYKSGESYRFDVGRVDVTENRGNLPDETYPKVGSLYDDARLPIGYFQLIPEGKVASETMRLSLYDAINRGSIVTDKGEINFTSYVHANKNYIIFETESTGEEINYTWKWNAFKAISPRTNASVTRPSNYSDYTSRPNPEVVIRKDGDYNLSIQELFAGITYVVAWKEVKNTDSRRIIVTISQEETTENAIEVAKQTIDECLLAQKTELEDSHKEWWNNYYPASFLTFANSKMESFYWAQIYKFACLTRPDKFVVDLQGPWATANTPWPAIWMNLNIQLTYSWMYAANRSEFSDPLWKALDDNIENLKKNVHNPEWRDEAIGIGRSASYNFLRLLDPSLAADNQYEVGNMPWILFYYWQYCKYNNKQDELINKFYPLLRKSMAYYSFIREEGTDGKYHLPVTASPEYKAAADCNYDLALLRWGLNTLLEINGKYQLNDEKEAHWTDFLENLVDYPIDATRGYMIGKDVNLTSSHRHYSHLLMIYPLCTINWDQEENRSLITKSINNWMSLTGALQGYSFTGSSSMYSTMGDGARATTQLQSLIDRYIQPNTLYKETGPVIETPLSAVASLHELYLQSWGGKIRVFHAVPDTWEDASFINLRTEGAFLVSATRDNGKTVFIQIESEAGGLCRLQTGMDLSNLNIKKLSGENIEYTTVDASAGLIEFTTQAGDIIQLSDKNTEIIYPAVIEHLRKEATPFGVNSGPEIPVEGIELPEEIILSKETPSVTIVPTILPEDAKNKNVTWKSNNEEVVKVQANGALVAYSKGETVVTATTVDGGFEASTTVKVIDDFKVFISSPIADSYVHDATASKGTNFGNNEFVVVKKDDAGYSREGYYLFSLEDLDNIDLEKEEANVTVSLYVNTTGAAANDALWVFNSVSNIDWIETGTNSINWNNKPSVGTAIMQIPGFVVESADFNSDNILNLDFTDYALAEYKKGNKHFSFQLTQSKRASGGGGLTNIASKEHADPQRHPKLTIQSYSKTVGIPLLENNGSKVYPTVTTGLVNVMLSKMESLSIRSLNGSLMHTFNPKNLGKY